MNYYNENEPKVAAWLKSLITAGLVSNGVVDERSITDVKASELKGFKQCHFFAGVGGWSFALRLAGWPDDKEVWTGSCPCQPFSCAGKGEAEKDARHLWPQFRRLIRKQSPAIVFGEQVASALGRLWLDGVFSDLEALGYANGGSDLCAAGLNAPHRRQRLYWMAVASSRRRHQRRAEENAQSQGGDSLVEQRGGFGGLADTEYSEWRTKLEASGARFWWPRLGGSSGMGYAGGLRCDERVTGDGRRQEGTRSKHGSELDRPSGSSGMDNSSSPRCPRAEQDSEVQTRDQARMRVSGIGCTEGQRLEHTTSGERGIVGDETQPGSGRHAIFTSWSGFDLIPCRDGKKRRVESGTFPLANGVPKRVVRLRGYGNAIVPELAAEFIQSAVEALK